MKHTYVVTMHNWRLRGEDGEFHPFVNTYSVSADSASEVRDMVAERYEVKGKIVVRRRDS